MERKYFKDLNFDLDTHQLKEHYTGANYRQAYDDLRRFFKRHRFSHRQGSGYISDDKLTTSDIYDLMDELSRQFPIVRNRKQNRKKNNRDSAGYECVLPNFCF